MLVSRAKTSEKAAQEVMNAAEKKNMELEAQSNNVRMAQQMSQKQAQKADAIMAKQKADIQALQSQLTLEKRKWTEASAKKVSNTEHSNDDVTKVHVVSSTSGPSPLVWVLVLFGVVAGVVGVWYLNQHKMVPKGATVSTDATRDGCDLDTSVNN